MQAQVDHDRNDPNANQDLRKILGHYLSKLAVVQFHSIIPEECKTQRVSGIAAVETFDAARTAASNWVTADAQNS
jgi:hypothetical protein